jgi:hypothetical protein
MKATRRFTDHKPVGKPLVLGADHHAILASTTLFPSRIKKATSDDTLFKSGKHSRKIGSHVTKGMWRGLPIYTLTLTERATCPAYCEHWHDCFGNKMHWSTRWRSGRGFESIVSANARALARSHPAGFVVRLHVLGDFYSRAYAANWASLMRELPMMRVFGYTRWRRQSPQGVVINFLNNEYPDRWRIRWSERGGTMGTITTKDVTQRGKTDQGIVCPAQTNDTSCCGTCALCWNSEQPIVFIEH